jgi:hypothetical protein
MIFIAIIINVNIFPDEKITYKLVSYDNTENLEGNVVFDNNGIIKSFYSKGLYSETIMLIKDFQVIFSNNEYHIIDNIKNELTGKIKNENGILKYFFVNNEYNECLLNYNIIKYKDGNRIIFSLNISNETVIFKDIIFKYNNKVLSDILFDKYDGVIKINKISEGNFIINIIDELCGRDILIETNVSNKNIYQTAINMLIIYDKILFYIYPFIMGKY